MSDIRLTGLIRHLQTGLAPAAWGHSDGDALRAFISFRDETAFAALVQRHGPMVLRVCQHVLNHRQDAEDALQATFLVLARRAETIGKTDSLASWLHGVAYRVALRARRDAGRRRARELQAITAPKPDPLEALAWHDVQALLEAEIERLPERFRVAFVLCYLEGRSRAETACELGIPENTVSSRLARARERLQKRLARRGVNLTSVLAAIALTTGSTEATISSTLIETTAQAAPHFALRQAVAGISSSTLQLTNGALRTMTIAKTKLAFGILAVSTTLVVGAWGAGQGQGPGPGGPPGMGPAAKNEASSKPAAIERIADFTQRQRSLHNLKLIMLAMHSYHDVHGQFPTDSVDKDGKLLLSWRVQLLPYLEEDNLFKQFNQKDSWDSEQNLKLLARMPNVFRVGFESKDATHTYYQRFAFDSAAWGSSVEGAGGFGGGGPPGVGPMGASGAPPMPMGGGSSPGRAPLGMGMGPSPAAPAKFPQRYNEIADGTANTLGLIEAGPPVPWSKPADIGYDPAKPLPSLAGPFANVRNVAAFDGTVHGLKPNLDEATLRALISPNDGNAVPALKTLRVSFPADTEAEKKVLAKLLEQNQALIVALEAQIAEHAALLALANKLTKDIDRAEEEQARIKAMIDTLKSKNKKLRDEFGLRGGAPVPK